MIRVLFHNLCLYLYILITVPPFAFLILFLALFDRRGRLTHRIGVFWLRGILWVSGVKLEVRGLEHLRRGESYIFAANHRSQFDIPVLAVALPYQIRWLAKESLFRIPLFGWALKAIGYIPVDRRNPRKGLKSLEAAALKVREGFSVVIFPEGTRSPDGRLLPFKTGGFVLAIKSGHPVVPVAICGTERIMPKGKLYVRPGLVRVKILQPIETRGLSLREKTELATLVRMKIEEALRSGCR
ncbi:MAG: 1-acyl-sn-glycerol-3-phosphate acyltransferase [Thermodesulfobacteria bacterium]|nr:1-acyl-sn-glycerol-3-phosphate acyltransferase [Thermodesulfobacteriota bacterium]